MNRFFLLILCLALLALAACSDNLFGSPGNGNCGTDVKCLQIDAENAFRDHNYARAYAIYSQIVGIDSTISVGYFGMAKAGLWMSRVNPFEVFAHVKQKEDGQIAFMDQLPAEQNRYFQGMRKAGPMLRELDRRDSLTALYEFHRRNIDSGFDSTFTITIMQGDSTIRIEVNLEKRLAEFRQTYCTAGECPGFPLSDRVFRYNTYSGGLLISSISEKILNTMDTNKDGCITRRCPASEADCNNYNPGEPTVANFNEWAKWGCEKNSKGGYTYDLSINLDMNADGTFEVNLNQILGDMDLEDYYGALGSNPLAELPEDILSLNEKMDEFNGNMNEIIDIMNVFKSNQGTEEIPFKWEDNIGSYNNYSTFYKIGTNIDEDGDGCIGEEILDGHDNDGDGLTNGNARLVPIDWSHPEKFSLDGINNSMAENLEWNLPKKYHKNDLSFKPICKDRANGDRCPMPEADEDDSITVMLFTQKMPNYWTNDTLDVKLMIAQDTICPPKYDLDYRKRRIGGCWPNYKEDTFRKYWLKRGYARPADRVKRTHPDCVNY